ncbi:hypothetical protein ASPCAL05292 [Aspergillus calidoustus]|uniref:Hydroxyneurosporene synthase n=1 Tax=Aspergillus calidoustus TaxID=454130 RepID=A0A0U5FX74_ASPCI|nr:hypothetical protein ASPCAL05292 [Aspergillus calidoustus]
MTLSSIVSISWLTFLSTSVLAQRTVVPAHFTGTEQSHTQWISNATGFDAPMNQPLNDTSFDWWYFDVVQEPDGRGQNHPSMAMTFHTTGRDGMDVFQNLFPLGLPSNNLIQINLNWPDGGKDAWVLVGDEAVITVEGDGASGEFRGTGCAFEGEADLSEYTVHVDAPEKGIVGTFRVRADVPPHYPCGPAEAGQDMQVVPGVGWMNAIPDGYGEADFSIRGKPFSVRGRGYHDHNYGSRPFSESAYSAYWGHGRLGEYAFVWLTVLTPTLEEHVSAYVTKGTEILVARCGGITIRPYGEHSTYPPTRRTGAPEGFTISVDTPDGLFELQAETIHIQINFDFYRRFTGRFTGTLDGEPLPDGVALWEQFALDKE